MCYSRADFLTRSCSQACGGDVGCLEVVHARVEFYGAPEDTTGRVVQVDKRDGVTKS
jgi:hypothetical protein